MKKWKVYWALVSYAGLLVLFYNINPHRFGSSNNNSLPYAIIWVIFSLIAGLVLYRVRNATWAIGRLTVSVPSGRGLAFNGIQRGISLCVAGIILLAQAQQVGHDGFRGIAWILGLGISACLILVSTHGVSFHGVVLDERLRQREEYDPISSGIPSAVSLGLFKVMNEEAAHPHAGDEIKRFAATLNKAVGLKEGGAPTEQQKAMISDLFSPSYTRPGVSSSALLEGGVEDPVGIKIVHFDPWLKQQSDDSQLDGALFVARFGAYQGVDTSPDAIFLIGDASAWELWLLESMSDGDMDQALLHHENHNPQWRDFVSSKGLAVVGKGSGTAKVVAQRLLEVLLRGRANHSSPCPPFVGGLLSGNEISEMVTGLNAEFDHSRSIVIAHALSMATPIIETARLLNLNPQPNGQNENAWVANCPSGGQHSIMISASANEFGCGYCRKKGGPAELIDFVESRHRRDS